MKKITHDQILAALLKINSDLEELKQIIQTLGGMDKKQIIPPRNNRMTQSKIFQNKKARELTIRLFKEKFTYDEVKQRLFSELNFLTSRSAISRFYRHLLKKKQQ